MRYITSQKPAVERYIVTITSKIGQRSYRFAKIDDAREFAAINRAVGHPSTILDSKTNNETK